MKKRGFLLFGLFIPAIALTIWLGKLELHYTFSPKIYVAATGYDPRDLLSGHYLNLTLDWEKTDCSQFENKVCAKERFERIYRYYLPEADAVFLEKEIFKNSPDLLLEFAYPRKGAPLIRNLTLDKQNWKDWIKTKRSKD